MKTYKAHLIRHGTTQANTDGIYCGQTDLPLSTQGEEELYRLAADYTFPLVDVVYVSPLSRARQSAAILFPDCEQIIVEDLQEIAFGIYEGRAFSQLKDDPAFQQWVSFGSDRVPQDAESHRDFFQRCGSAITHIITDMMRNGVYQSAVVTHAGVISNMLASIAFPRKSPYDWQTYSGCGYTVQAIPSLFLRNPVVEVIGYVPRELEEI